MNPLGCASGFFVGFFRDSQPCHRDECRRQVGSPERSLAYTGKHASSLSAGLRVAGGTYRPADTSPQVEKSIVSLRILANGVSELLRIPVVVYAIWRSPLTITNCWHTGSLLRNSSGGPRFVFDLGNLDYSVCFVVSQPPRISLVEDRFQARMYSP